MNWNEPHEPSNLWFPFKGIPFRFIPKTPARKKHASLHPGPLGHWAIAEILVFGGARWKEFLKARSVPWNSDVQSCQKCSDHEITGR